MASTKFASKFAKTNIADAIDAVESKPRATKPRVAEPETAYNPINSMIEEGITVRDVSCLLFGVVYGYASMSVCLALLIPFMSFWLAVIIAFIAALVSGHYANLWFQQSGYGHCVNVAAKIGGLFQRTTSRFAAA